MKAKKIDSLTSLRFFAAAIIVTLHASELFGRNAFLRNFATFHAVSFFYVLSGFILAYTYRDIQQTRADLSRYAWARIARILPVHVATWAMALVLFHDGGWSIKAILANLFLVQSWVPSSQYFYAVNGVSWSISDEVFFYALLPLMLIRVQRTWLSNFFLCGLVTASILWIARWTTGDVRLWVSYIFPITRVVEFMAGVAVFQISRNITGFLEKISRPSATILEVITVCAVALSMHLAAVFYGTKGMVSLFGTAFPLWVYSAASFPVFAILVLVFSAQAGMLSRILCFKPIVFLGEASFALYMIHKIIARLISEHSYLLSYAPTYVNYAAYWAASLGAAACLHLLIENPARRFLLDISRRGNQRSAPTGAN
ncbi:acyltransferase [Paraburkholderia sediminicola]|uniref:acyltransferase family protein n=1 Tax=Paraburkholderia sediminicola TaxID=458836 RepID=UPI0038BBFF83